KFMKISETPKVSSSIFKSMKPVSSHGIHSSTPISIKTSTIYENDSSQKLVLMPLSRSSENDKVSPGSREDYQCGKLKYALIFLFQ
ncbi:unnamed protein product, partial [Heterobilharzia americana]